MNGAKSHGFVGGEGYAALSLNSGQYYSISTVGGAATGGSTI